MSWLLDTNAVIALRRAAHSPLAERIRRCSPADIFVSAIVLHELFYGIFRSDRVDRNLARLESLDFEVLSFDADDAREAGAIRAHLARLGTPIGPHDTLIAGQARARNLVLVTRNTGEFARVPDLKVEDWEVP